MLNYHAIERDTIAAALTHCTVTFYCCRSIHAYLIESEFCRDEYLLNLVLRSYGKIGAVSDARHVFDSMHSQSIVSVNTILTAYIDCNQLENAQRLFHGLSRRNVVSWNALMSAYANSDTPTEAIVLFRKMHQASLIHNHVTLLNLLSICANMKDLGTGKVVHTYVDGCGLELSLRLGTALMNMYGKCEVLKDVRIVFDELNDRDVVSWTALISSYARLGYGNEAITFFHQMQQEGVSPNKITLLNVLSAVGNAIQLHKGKEVHSSICAGFLDRDVDVESAVICMYGKCGDMKLAWSMFEAVDSNSLIQWNTIIAACIDLEYHIHALHLFTKLLRRGLKPNEFTFSSALSVCAHLSGLYDGALINSYVVEEGYMDDVVINNALINVYSKCKAVDDAEAIFQRMFSRSVVTWTSMIVAYTQEGYNQSALQLFYEMQHQKMKPNDVSVVCALNACGELAAVEATNILYSWINFEGSPNRTIIANAVVNMYGKCGELENAYSVFKHLHHQNVVSWNTLVAAYSYARHGKEALACLIEMEKQGGKPDELTLISLLSALSHSGMVVEAILCLVSMVHYQLSVLVLEHYVCIIDLLGRAGRLVEAYSLLSCIPVVPDTCLFFALMAASELHSHYDWMNHYIDCIIELDG